MIGALPSHETRLGRATASVPVLQRQLHRRLDRFRTAARVNDVRELRSAAREQQARELLEGFARKEVAVTARHLFQLRGDRRVDLAVTGTHAERGGAARA